MKRAKRILCGLLALTLTLSLLLVGTVTVAYAAKTAEQEAAEQEKAAQMAALEQKKKEQADKLKELEKQIADAKKKKEDVMATKNLLISATSCCWSRSTTPRVRSSTRRTRSPATRSWRICNTSCSVSRCAVRRSGAASAICPSCSRPPAWPTC